jgi:hypothetical protein
MAFAVFFATERAYICGEISTMQRHLKSAYAWESGSKGGRPSKAAQKGESYGPLYRYYVSCVLPDQAALQKDTSVRLERPPEMTSLLEAHLAGSEHEVADIYRRICSHLQSGTHTLVRTTQMLPRLSPTSILSHLASARAAALPPDWKKSFVSYGLSVAALQRAGRLLAAAGDETELLSELVNAGHQDWDVMRYPEWLLLEIENNILIRQEQALISQEMMSPSSGSNSVMQLNMGLGKSSVIVPIVAAALADTT